jgi:glycosyltransferase involved in cell wall biosynthesis
MSKVSVILTSFNHGNQIHKSIDSVLSQSYENYEVLIWDDASSDNSWNVIKTYNDSRIKVFRNKENRRGIWGLNKSISEIADGDYIAVHHSGDVWHKDKLKKQVEVLEKNTAIGAVFTYVDVINENDQPLKDSKNFYFDIFTQPNKTRYEWLRFFLSKGNALCHPSVLIRKSCFDECGLYRYGLAQTGDFDMWLRLCLKYEIFVIDEKLTYFRIENNDGNTSAHNKVTETRSFYECYKIISDILNKFEPEDWKQVFPEYFNYAKGVDEYIFARILIDLDTMHPVKVLGLDMLFDLLQDEALSSKIKTIYKFSYHDFIELSYSIDPFNVSKINDFKSDIRYLILQNEGVVNKHKQEIELFTSSISWKLTKPIRAIRRLLTNPSAYLPLLKRMIKRTPFLSLARVLQQRYIYILNYFVSVPLSSQNMKYINQTSERRAHEHLSIRHINCITADIDLESLPNIDISIVTFNNGTWLSRFSESLLEQSYPLVKLNLCFVDNGSEDKTLQLLEEFKITYKNIFGDIQIHSRPNLGFGAGHDYAIQKFNNDLFLVTNIDLEFSKDSLVNVLKFAMNDINEVACWELRQKPYEHPKYYDPVTLETAWCSHACVLIRREAYEKVGGYEPRIFMYGEDVELSYRFRSYGYRLRYIPHAFVHHYAYEEVHQVKPLQFSGSTLANALLRFRYGDLKDKVIGLILQVALLLRGAGFPNSRRLILGNFKKLMAEVKYFPTIDRKSNCYFPFRYFDYEMIRDGAFYELSDFSLTDTELPLVTIITRTYQGRGHFLKECMVSVINQTYPNIQHIIVEDGGNTHADLVSKTKFSYGSAYNVEFHGFEKKGRSFTGNQGLKKATGEYCLFLDDDDLIFPDHIEVLVSEALKDLTLSAVYSLAWDVHTDIFQDNNEVSYHEKHFETLPLFYQEYDFQTLLNHNYIPIQSILFKRKLYEDRGGFEEDMDQLEDWNLWTRFAFRSTFKYTPKTTSLFRTPADKEERMRRAKILDSAFFYAIEKQKKIC